MNTDLFLLIIEQLLTVFKDLLLALNVSIITELIMMKKRLARTNGCKML